MKMIAEYIKLAQKFEQLFAHESDPELKASFGREADAYRKLATERAKKLGLEPPETSN
jgi:hypothetical protein